jgi:hypothetical protein
VQALQSRDGGDHLPEVHVACGQFSLAERHLFVVAAFRGETLDEAASGFVRHGVGTVFEAEGGALQGAI